MHKAFDTRIFVKQCKSLAAAGVEVSYVVPHEESVLRDGVAIVGLPLPKSRLQRMVVTSCLVLRRALEVDADIYHFHDPELVPTAVVLRLTGKRVVYDVHEDLPSQIYSKSWIPRWLMEPAANVARLIQAIGVRVAHGVVAATPAIADIYSRVGSVPVQNFPPADIAASEPVNDYEGRPPWVVYHGGITALRGACEMVRAMESVSAPGAQLKIAGAFEDPALHGQLETLEGWRDVDYVGWKSHDELVELMRASRIGLVLFHPAPNHTRSQPNKLFEYMAMGIPVVASNFPAWRELIEGVGCGLLVDPLKPDEIAEAVDWLLENTAEARAMGERGRAAVKSHYNWDKQLEALISVYERVGS